MSIETEILENFIRVPCFRYAQADRLYYSITMPMNQLDKFLCIDNSFNVLERSQRLVETRRVKKLVNYLEKGKFILPSLTGFIEGECKFKAFGKHADLGYLEISLDSVIKLFDGQHRASGIVSACCKSYDLKNKLKKSSITLNLTNALTLSERQQFFSDINTNVSKPSISLSSAYNKTDSRYLIAHRIIKELDLTLNIEYEKNVIHRDDKLKFFTFKSFSDSISRAFGLRQNTEITDELISDILYIYEGWRNVFKWNLIVDIANVRNKTINFHNMMIVLIGDVTRELLYKYENNHFIVNEKIENSKIDYLLTFQHKNLYDVCIDAETDRIKLDAVSKNNLKNYINNLIEY